jgi:hypothetical protein
LQSPYAYCKPNKTRAPQTFDPCLRPQTDLEDLRSEAEARATRLQEAAAAREAQLSRGAEAAAQALYERVDALQADLEGVADFRDRQVGLMKHACTQGAAVYLETSLVDMVDMWPAVGGGLPDNNKRRERGVVDQKPPDPPLKMLIATASSSPCRCCMPRQSLRVSWRRCGRRAKGCGRRLLRKRQSSSGVWRAKRLPAWLASEGQKGLARSTGGCVALVDGILSWGGVKGRRHTKTVASLPSAANAAGVDGYRACTKKLHTYGRFVHASQVPVCTWHPYIHTHRYYAGQNSKMRKEYEQRLEELKHAQVRGRASL